MFAGIAIGRVITPPNPVIKPDVVHFIIELFISLFAASSLEFDFSL